MDDMQITCEVDGIPIVVDRSRLDDFDTLEMFYDLKELADNLEDGGLDGDGAEGMLTVVPFARTLFGRQQWKRIKQTLREDSDENHLMRCINFIFAAMDAASKAQGGELKN